MKQWARTWLRTGAFAAMVAAALLFAAAPRAKAQDGSISGTLLDLEGKPWPDYTLTIEGDQGTKADTKTDKGGKYSFNGLKAGTYKITANPGASFVGGIFNAEGVDVEAAGTMSINIPLDGIAPAALSLRQFRKSCETRSFWSCFCPRCCGFSRRGRHC